MQIFAEVQTGQRFERDVWEQDVLAWVDVQSIQETTVRDALNGALLMTPDKMSKADERRMRAVLKLVGFVKSGTYKDRARRDQAKYVRKMGE